MISIVLPVIVVGFLYRRVNSVLRVLALLVLTTFIFEIVSYLFGIKYGNNMPFFHLNTFIEFGIITVIYYKLSSSLAWKGVLLSFFFIFLLFSFYSLLDLQGIWEMNSYQRYLEAVFVLVYTMNYIRIYSMREKIHRQIRRAYYILTCAFMFYFTTTSVLFFYGNEIIADDQSNLYLVHSIFNILLNISYATVLYIGWKDGMLRKSSMN